MSRPIDASDAGTGRACAALSDTLTARGIPAVVEAAQTLALLHLDAAAWPDGLDAATRADCVHLAREAGFTHVAMVLESDDSGREVDTA